MKNTPPSPLLTRRDALNQLALTVTLVGLTPTMANAANSAPGKKTANPSTSSRTPPKLHPVPGVEKQMLISSDALSPKNSEGSAVALKNGDILFVWSQFMVVDLMAAAGETPPRRSAQRRGALGDDGYARISAIRSSDGGRTWGKPQVVVDDRDATVNCISPGLTRTSDGRLMMAYSWRSSNNAEKTHASKMVRFSSDEGVTWSERVRITPENKEYHTGCHDRAYTLRTGRLLVQCHTLFPNKPRKEMGVYTAYSDDGGRTWRRSAVLAEKKTNYFEEGSIVERADGSLLMALRASRGNSYFTESRDGGATWSEPRPSGVLAPMAPTLLARLPGSDDLLMVWNSNHVPGGSLAHTRSPLLCAISHDHGGTWGLPKGIEVDRECQWAYPGVLFHEKTALLHYFRSTPGQGIGRELVLARIPVEWFYADNA